MQPLRLEVQYPVSVLPVDLAGAPDDEVSVVTRERLTLDVDAVACALADWNHNPYIDSLR